MRRKSRPGGTYTARTTIQHSTERSTAASTKAAGDKPAIVGVTP